MAYWWIQSKGIRGTIEAPNRQAAATLVDGVKVEDVIGTLPYPRTPVLFQEKGNRMPALCYGGPECLNATCCPRSYACTE